MKFTPLQIPDVILIQPEIFEDGRGFFFEMFREDVFAQNGIKVRFVQNNYARSAKGVLRGLHYQAPPRAQAKILCVTKGKIFDVAVDIRKSSPTFGRHVSLALSAQDRKMLYVPVGFAHGYLALEEGTEVLYQVSDFYAPELEQGILWNDPELGIAWPKIGKDYILSLKDQKYPSLKKARIFDGV